MHLIDVVLLSPPFKKYTYKIPAYLKNFTFHPGLRVVVPVKNRYLIGITLDTPVKKEVEFDIKDLVMPIDRTPIFFKEQLEIFEDISSHLLVEMGQVISSIMPSDLCSLKLYFLDSKGKRHALYNMLNKKEKGLISVLEKWVHGETEICTSSREDLVVELISLPPWPIKKTARTQLNILEYLHAHGPLPKSQLTSKFGKYSSKVISVLLSKNLIQVSKKKYIQPVCEKLKFLSPYEPTKEQDRVISSLLPVIENGFFKTVLLHGVTGSGKTLVYSKLIKKSLELNKSSILLSPEVALAETTYKEIKHFSPGVPIYFYHGYLPKSLRAKIFKEIANQNPPYIVIGTRSSIFLPLKKIGTIIIDEEHDSSYKQDERLRYHVREVSFLLARKFKSLLVYGSATPDVKTYFAAQNQKIELLKMDTRVKGNPLPEINLVDLNKEQPVHGPFSQRVFSQIKSTLDMGDQVIILLNRRGFSPLVFCTSCREVVKCPNCSVSMTYHKKVEKLICHYCGHVIPFPCDCPVCGSVSYLPLDVGTEQIEELITDSFGHTSKILRLDRDTYRHEKKEEDILRGFANGEYQILIGTQMCSKGHNFPGVTLVVVVDGDIGLNLPDYRATERTFQLLVQVAGRSGRGEKPGRVFIQTRNPNHYCWKYITKNDYEGFFQHELQLRRLRRYPPFVKLGLLRFHLREKDQQNLDFLEDLTDYIQKVKTKDLIVLGPAPAPIFVLNKEKRYQCLIKADSYGPIRSFAAKILQKYSKNKKDIKVILDMDPYHML